jgi:hypothetical protein
VTVAILRRVAAMPLTTAIALPAIASPNVQASKSRGRRNEEFASNAR